MLIILWLEISEKCPLSHEMFVNKIKKNKKEENEKKKKKYGRKCSDQHSWIKYEGRRGLAAYSRLAWSVAVVNKLTYFGVWLCAILLFATSE